MELVLYAFFVISVSFGDHAISFSTLQECQDTRLSVVRQIEVEAPKYGDAVFVSECQRVTPKMYDGKKTTN